MATYTEISELLAWDEPSGLRNRVAVAVMVAADVIRQQADDGTAPVRERKRYAQRLLSVQFNHNMATRADNAALATSEFESVYRAVLIANRAATKAQIQGASDVAIQNAVNDAVAFLAPRFQDPAPVGP